MIRKRNKKAKHYVNNEDLYTALKKYKIECDIIENKWIKQYGEQKEQLLADGIKPRKIFDHLPKILWPRVPEYIGKCVLLIATKLNNAPNFYSYSYKDEMVADGYEDCILRIKSFNINQAAFKVYYTGGDKPDMQLMTKSIDEVISHVKTAQPDNTEITVEDILDKIGLEFSVDIEYDGWRIRASRNPFSYFTQTCYFASVRRIKKEKKQKVVKSEMVKNSGVILDMQTSTQTGDDAAYNNTYLAFLMENIDGEVKKEDKQKNIFKKTTKAHQAKLKAQDAQEKEELLHREKLTFEDNHKTSESTHILDVIPDEYYSNTDSDEE